ncbi:MAG: hypothetical protein KatS3mg114_0268 [Planctomycetaceae bacterium]|nr:MAG: hypothetical protein KatS3mg114_0268 [Planctomycetaceae bacterium]
MRLTIRVKPRSRRTSLTPQPDGTWLAELKSPPVDGQANAELIALIAQHFGCPQRRILLKRGAHSRLKVIEIFLEPE